MISKVCIYKHADTTFAYVHDPVSLMSEKKIQAVIVIDCSSSMTNPHDYFPMIKAAISKWLLAKAPLEIAVQLITFGEYARLLWSTDSLVDGAGHGSRQQAVDMISSGVHDMGCTNLDAGLRQAMHVRSVDCLSTLILITDGDANAGKIQSPGGLAQLTQVFDKTASIMFGVDASHQLSNAMRCVNPSSAAYFSNRRDFEFEATFNRAAEALQFMSLPQYELCIGTYKVMLTDRDVRMGIPILLKNDLNTDSSEMGGSGTTYCVVSLCFVSTNVSGIETRQILFEGCFEDLLKCDVSISKTQEAHELWKGNCAAIAKAYSLCIGAASEVKRVRTENSSSAANNVFVALKSLEAQVSLDIKEAYGMIESLNLEDDGGAIDGTVYQNLSAIGERIKTTCASMSGFLGNNIYENQVDESSDCVLVDNEHDEENLDLSHYRSLSSKSQPKSLYRAMTIAASQESSQQHALVAFDGP